MRTRVRAFAHTGAGDKHKQLEARLMALEEEIQREEEKLRKARDAAEAAETAPQTPAPTSPPFRAPSPSGDK